jgi:hypothetical protein
MTAVRGGRAANALIFPQERDTFGLLQNHLKDPGPTRGLNSLSSIPCGNLQ